MNLRHLQEDAPVRVFDDITPAPVPEGGYEGIVTAVGRKYLVIAFFRSNASSEREIRVSREDGRSPDIHQQFRVMTPEAADAVVARRKYQATLRTVGITVDTGSGKMPDDLLAELAAHIVLYQKDKGEEDSGTGQVG